MQVWQLGGRGDEASSKAIDAAALMQHYGRSFAGEHDLYAGSWCYS